MKSFDYFCIRHSWIIGIVMLICILSLALFYGKGVYYVYSDALEIRDFQNELQERTKWASTPSVYIHGTSAPFRQREGAHCAIPIYLFGVGFCMVIF